MQVAADWKTELDLRLREGSPAVAGGSDLPAEWPDPLRGAGKGKPDVGAVPAGGEPWRVGVGGRLAAFGTAPPVAANPARDAGPAG